MVQCKLFLQRINGQIKINLSFKIGSRIGEFETYLLILDMNDINIVYPKYPYCIINGIQYGY